ncbi:DUF1289 domain-containing protein [Gilvimarinus xylanilyticus]|uniref:DUF1289 domain-containing protein n=1 Tax=Gilvimarinus xylanilyticus TaxID=2944139 RepID=A0A9X2KSQ7_9GAMM|nr:DUF1289 domain-containing protein [Gilvimarinus xylanilyticus]MCP8898377.1 DUF1289 domain-containing protein [Gilvimarinus xylanilyticus]
MPVFTPVKTPCVGVCSTGIGDSVCRGCKRFAHEVIHWNAYSEDQRRVIASRLETYLTQVVANHIAVIDQALLLTQIRHQQIQFNPDQSPECWAFDLLRAGASQINDLAVYGLQLQPGSRALTLVAIRDDIDRDFYALSCAYYERYIAPGLTSA